MKAILGGFDGTTGFLERLPLLDRPFETRLDAPAHARRLKLRALGIIADLLPRVRSGLRSQQQPKTSPDHRASCNHRRDLRCRRHGTTPFNEKASETCCL